MKRAYFLLTAACVIAWPARLPAQSLSTAAASLPGPAGTSGGPQVPQPAVRLTLADAVARGLEASHHLAELAARQTAVEASVAGREAADRPQVSVQAGYTRTNHITEFGIPSPGGITRLIYPDVPNNYRARLDLQWPIYTFGRVEAAERAARSELAAVGRDVAAAQGDLRLDITRAYWALQTARESVRVVEEALKRIDAHLADVRNRLDVGLIPPNDVLSVEAQRSRQQVALIEARNASELAAADLRRLAGLPPDAPVEIAEPLDARPAPPEPLEALVGEARANRPERQALERRVAAAGDRRDAAAAGTKPIIALAGGFDYARPNPRIFPRAGQWNDSWDASINVSWSIWDAGRVRAEVAEASANQDALRARLADLDSLLDLEVRQRRLDLQAATASIDAASDAVRSAAEARRVVADRFAAGVATSTEVLDAQVDLLQAELERTRALANARLAAARLARAVGR